MLMPFLTGERSPNWDPSIRAALIGFDLAHGPGHFARAAMEGVAYRLKSVFEPIAEMAGVIRSVRIGGGFIASPTWVQIVADVLNFAFGDFGGTPRIRLWCGGSCLVGCRKNKNLS